MYQLRQINQYTHVIDSDTLCYILFVNHASSNYSLSLSLSITPSLSPHLFPLPPSLPPLSFHPLSLSLSLCSVSPTISVESSFHILPTLEESESFSYKPVPPSNPPQKASTLPTNMNPSDIMNFNYLGNGVYPTHNSSSNNHVNTNSYYNYNNNIKRPESSGRRLNGYSNVHVPHNGTAGTIDNFDCINELLEEGLEHNGGYRRERVSIGGEVDRRRVFPAENTSQNFITRSYTLQK